MTTTKKKGTKKVTSKKVPKKKAAPKKAAKKAGTAFSGMKLFGRDFNKLDGLIDKGDIQSFNFVPITGYAARFNPEMQKGFIIIQMAGGRKEFELDPAGMAATLTMLKSFNCSYNGQYIGFNLL